METSLRIDDMLLLASVVPPRGFRARLARRLFQRFHRYEIWAGTVPPRNAPRRQLTQRRSRVAYHDVQRERRPWRDARSGRYRHPGREESIGARFRIRACSLDRLGYH